MNKYDINDYFELTNNSILFKISMLNKCYYFDDYNKKTNTDHGLYFICTIADDKLYKIFYDKYYKRIVVLAQYYDDCNIPRTEYIELIDDYLLSLILEKVNNYFFNDLIPTNKFINSDVYIKYKLKNNDNFNINEVNA